MSPRARPIIQEGASKRLQRLKYCVTMIHLAMPEGMERNEALDSYAVETGLTPKKAEEHLRLLESTGMLRWDDLRLYVTDKGLRWVGFTRDNAGELLDSRERAEEKHRESANANAQKAPSDTNGSRRPKPD